MLEVDSEVQTQPDSGANAPTRHAVLPPNYQYFSQVSSGATHGQSGMMRLLR